MEAATLTYLLLALPVIRLAKVLPVGHLEDARDLQRSREASAPATRDESREY